MLPAEVIRSKRDGGALSDAQISAFVRGMTRAACVALLVAMPCRARKLKV